MAYDILTVAEFSALSPMVDKSFCAMVKDSKLPWLSTRDQRRFHREDLDSRMASQVNGSGAPEQAEAKPKSSTRKGDSRR